MNNHKQTEAQLPLAEQLTLVVITHNRNAHLRRALQYYDAFGAKILVLDSSSVGDATVAGDYPQVDYRHLPQFERDGFQAKLTYGVTQVTTPFMAFAADDDFIFEDGLKDSVAFLNANPDYGLCHGYGLVYLAYGTEVAYFSRDKIVCEDYDAETAQERMSDFLGQYLPPFYGVTRTEIVQQWYASLEPGLSLEWQEVGHACFLLASAKARILPIAYSVRENFSGSDHNTNVYTALSCVDPKSVAQREAFADFLVSLPVSVADHVTKQSVLDSFAIMAECLVTGRSMGTTKIVRSQWRDISEPVRRFSEQQFVELPFYNKTVFDRLAEIEFLIHAMPAGRVQIKELEAALLKQEELMQLHPNDTAATIKSRLWEALGCSVFSPLVVERLIAALTAEDEQQDAVKLGVWAERLKSVPMPNRRDLFDSLPSGKLLNWLEARKPNAGEVKSIAAHLARHDGGPQFGVLLLDLDADMVKLQATFDSLVGGFCKAFKIVVLTTGDLPATTTADQTVHFVKVTASNYVDRINQSVGQIGTDWVVLAESGDQFTPAGLYRASVELIGAQGCRAVAMDELQRQSDGTLVDVFRPGVNLDLLQSVPSMMSRHWLIRREVLVGVGGFSSELTQALEFDLLMRLIESGGLAGLAHLAEPLLICQAPTQEGNSQESQVLNRHLTSRGYRAQVSSVEVGTYQIDYRHNSRPLVSIILQSQDNLPYLQRCLVSILQRTRYQNYEIVIADNASESPELATWLGNLEQKGGRIRVARAAQRLSASSLTNAAVQEAKGEYLLLLSADGEVVNANWIECLLNQAQRPEVGIVGARLVDRRGGITQAGLILGFDQGVGAALFGEPKGAKGYMGRLAVEQNYSAVSSACMMVRKELYEAVGGMDSECFAEHFNDVDLCLKIAEAGYLTVWTPQVQIIHPGALSQSPQALQALGEKWPVYLQNDPAYNQNHARNGRSFSLPSPQRVDWSQVMG